ncbi:hypothetical protein ACTQ4Z_05370 [Anaerovoracaceae bacterium Sow4_D4]
MPYAYSRRLKSISFFLIFVLVFEILFSSAEWFAYGDTNATDTKESSETLPNDLSKSEVLEKGTDYTIFKNPDGTRSMDIYQADVRTQDEMVNSRILTTPLRKRMKREKQYIGTRMVLPISLSQRLLRKKIRYN